MAEGMRNKKWIMDKLVENADKKFVQRLFKKDAPQMDIGDGRVMTHRMSWSIIGPPNEQKYIVYPEVVWDNKTRGLHHLDRQEAVERAENTKEYIEVGSKEEADELSKNYKEAIPGFLERTQPGGGGPGSQSYQIAPSKEEVLKTKMNKKKLGLTSDTDGK